MSIFKFIKYSSLIYFLGRHRSKFFRSVAVLLFAFLTSLIYDDVRHYLEIQHPGTLLYALIAKIIIVYGALLFVLWQFRPRPARAAEKAAEDKRTDAQHTRHRDRLDAFANIDTHDRLKSRYDRILSNDSTLRSSAAKESQNREIPPS